MIETVALKLVTLSVCISLCSSVCLANRPTSDSRKRTVDNFFRAWLVHKNIPAALYFFYNRALSHVSVIDSCVRDDYVAESERDNPSAVRSGVSKFLKEGSRRIKGHRLDNILFLTSKENPQQSNYLSTELKNISFNKPKRDRYYLATLNSVKSLSKRTDDWDDFERNYDLRDAFVAVIQYRVLNENEPYGEGTVLMLLWVRAGSHWKVVFAAVPSCSA